MTQLEIVNALHHVFPNGYYPPDKLYRILAEKNGWSPGVIQNQRGGLSTVAWMRSIGLEPLEIEMQPRIKVYSVSDYVPEMLSPLLSEAFSGPLLGNINPTIEQRKCLYEYARDVLLKAINSKSILTDIDCDIVLLETVLLLQNWNDPSRDAESEEIADTPFWEYICEQYAIPYDMNFGGSFTYILFQAVINKCLTKHRRLLAQSGKKYYTTLLTHALAPKNKFEVLFEQIYHFYTKDLDYKFIEGDTAFYAFSSSMKKRFSGETNKINDDIYIKSLQSSSAIKLLFSACPYYMGTFVRDVLRGIDRLVSTGEYEGNTYIELLLKAWYQRRSHDVRLRDRSERQRASYDRVETDYSRIRLSYQLKDNKVILCIPSIRFDGQSSDPPELRIYMNSDCILTVRLRYHDSDFCITSIKTEISIDALKYEDEKINLKAAISCGGEDVYSSGDKLCRNALIFDDKGIEITKCPEIGSFFYLYASAEATIDEDGIVDSPQCDDLSENAKLYRIMMGEDTRVIVNGLNHFPKIIASGNMHIEMPTLQMKNVSYLLGQQEYVVFNESPCLLVSVFKNSDKLYRVSIDNQHNPLATFQATDKNSWNILMPADEGCHEVQIIDNTTNYVLYNLKYIVKENFSVRFNGFYSPFNLETGSVTILDNGEEKIYPYVLVNDEMKMCLPYGSGDFVIDIPTLICTFNCETLSSKKSKIEWYKNIPMYARISIESPRGYNVKAVIGNRVYDDLQIEIGNIIMAMKHERPTESVEIIVYKGGEETKKIRLFEIAFEPRFEEAPLLIEDNQMLWCVEDNFIGDNDAKFSLFLYKKGCEIARYSLGENDEVIEKHFPFSNGLYSYTITMQESGFFSTSKEIYRGTLVVGDPAEFRFDGQAVIVTAALIENEKVALNPDSGIITGLKYIGELPLNGEKRPYPCYEGCLQYQYKGKLRPYADHDYEYNSIRHEQINPVMLWTINDYNISLRRPDEDGLYINRAWKSITDRLPEKYSKGNYDNPDYYLYRVEEAVNIV